MTFSNITEMFAKNAATFPSRPAIVVPVGRDHQGKSLTKQLSFKQLNDLCDKYAHGLTDFGFKQGDRVLLMLNPGIDLIAVVLALLKKGSIPVIIDPGMGYRVFSQCVSETEPKCFIGIPKSHILRFIFRKSFKTVNLVVTVGKSRIWRGITLEKISEGKKGPFSVVSTKSNEEAVIAFTSGGTGVPKGVLFTHGMIRATVNSLRNDLNIASGEVHLAAFYAFALFMPSLGATIIIPDMDPTKTAEVNPAYLVEAIHNFKVTNSMGSPLIWKILADYCLEKEITLPTLKHVHMFGAAVPPKVILNLIPVMEGGKVYTPYGATEALPITNISDEEIITEEGEIAALGTGVCIGRPIAGATVKIIKITDDPILEWNDSLVVPQIQVGEIVAKGPTVTQTYINRPQKTAEAKITDSDGSKWHRMGDLGYIDHSGLIMFCGRKAHRVESSDGKLFTPAQVEPIFNQHPEVKRSALVGIGEFGKQTPVILIEPISNKQFLSNTSKKRELILELLALGEKFDQTKTIKDILIYNKKFPVDVRHNTKIQRHKLVDWARKNR